MSAGLVYYQGKMKTFIECRVIERGVCRGMVEVTLREVMQSGRGPLRTWEWVERKRVVEPACVIRRYPEKSS